MKLLLSVFMVVMTPVIYCEYMTKPVTQTTFAEQYFAAFGEKPSEVIWASDARCNNPGKCGCHQGQCQSE